VGNQDLLHKIKKPSLTVSLLEADRDFIKSQVGLPEPMASAQEITAHPSFCQHIVSHRLPLIMEDARTSHYSTIFLQLRE